jgi:hypothetical protein
VWPCERARAVVLAVRRADRVEPDADGRVVLVVVNVADANVPRLILMRENQCNKLINKLINNSNLKTKRKTKPYLNGLPKLKNKNNTKYPSQLLGHVPR